MKTWDSKLVTFLNGENVILVKNQEEFTKLREILARIGLKMFNDTEDYNTVYKTCIETVKRQGREYKLGENIAIEYTNHKGFTYGWWSMKEIEDWYGIKAFSAKEIFKEIEK